MTAVSPEVARPVAEGLDARPRPPSTIVPLRGVPIMLVVLGLLIATIAADFRWGLQFFHIVGGGLWTGIDLFVGFVVGPIVGRMSVPARIEFSTRFMPKMLLLMPTLVTMTLASGWQIAHNLGLLETGYRHWWLVASYIVVGLMATIAIGILEPANIAVLFELRKPQPRPEVIMKLMRRFIYTAGATGVLQVATLVIMTRLAS